MTCSNSVMPTVFEDLPFSGSCQKLKIRKGFVVATPVLHCCKPDHGSSISFKRKLYSISEFILNHLEIVGNICSVSQAQLSAKYNFFFYTQIRTNDSNKKCQIQ